MMKVHIFNPEHDMALAADLYRFTAPHAGRQMRKDLGFIPALWAEDGDLVVVDDVAEAVSSARHLKRFLHDVLFVTMDDLRDHTGLDADDVVVSPWGWNRSLRHDLVTVNGCFSSFLPSEEDLQWMRTVGGRPFAAGHLLPALCVADSRCVGKAFRCDTMEEVLDLIARHRQCVLKAPWSGSGRGIRYVGPLLDDHQYGWCRNVIRQQGCVMVEPYYNKVLDFGMEFTAEKSGAVVYRGLSLFRTKNGAYVGNILATEIAKREMLSRYMDLTLIDRVCGLISSKLSDLLGGRYAGPLGVDMMVVASDGCHGGFLLHPCVELNLRRTMGHVALAVSPDETQPQGLMRIVFEQGRYKLRINNTNENLVCTDFA